MTHAERERLFLDLFPDLFRENKSRILLRGDRPRFHQQCAALAFRAAGGINLIYLGARTALALVAWRLGLWLREKRDAAERRPPIAQLTAMERALQALKEGVA
jgi:hypothetical protein